MQRQKLSMLFGLILMSATPMLALGAPPPPPPDYFPLRVGDWWKYQSTTGTGQKSEFQIKVTAFDKASGIYTVETTAGAMAFDEFYSKPAGLVNWHKEVYVKNNMTAEFKPTREYLKNPLAVGDSWAWTGTGMMNTAIDEKDTVAGTDAITVPAGKFTASHVHTDVTQGGAPVKKDYWYANWVGLVKSQTDSGSVTSTTELMDYSFKKK
jgi:hypothetical protein